MEILDLAHNHLKTGKKPETTLKYFTPEELRCSCCDQDGMNEAFMDKVSELREQLGFPFIVTSAYRCVKHPIEARKNSPGAHTTGRAIDIGVSGLDAYVVLRAALNAGFTGIGVKQKGKGKQQKTKRNTGSLTRTRTCHLSAP